MFAAFNTTIAMMGTIDDVTVTVNKSLSVAEVTVEGQLSFHIVALVDNAVRFVCDRLGVDHTMSSTGKALRFACNLVQRALDEIDEWDEQLYMSWEAEDCASQCPEMGGCYAGLLQADLELSGVPEYIEDTGMNFRDQDHWSQARGRAC